MSPRMMRPLLPLLKLKSTKRTIKMHQSRKHEQLHHSAKKQHLHELKPKRQLLLKLMKALIKKK